MICWSTWLILVCTLARDQTHNLGIERRCSNQLSYLARAMNYFNMRLERQQHAPNFPDVAFRKEMKCVLMFCKELMKRNLATSVTTIKNYGVATEHSLQEIKFCTPWPTHLAFSTHIFLISFTFFQIYLKKKYGIYACITWKGLILCSDLVSPCTYYFF